jgi:CRISPR-associated protein Csm2
MPSANPPTDPKDLQKPNLVGKPALSRASQPTTQNHSDDITATIIQQIHQLNDGFSKYQIRTLVEHSEKFGIYLKQNQLKTNQVRKFLDAVNRIKADLRQDEDFSKIETEIVLLKPKLAYAAARQSSVQALSQVMSAAIDKVHSVDDFNRLVQFLESTIAYHKASGGKD